MYAPASPTTTPSAKAAQVLEDESADLCQAFGNALREKPEGFDYTVRLEGFAKVVFVWEAVGQTAGMLTILPFEALAGRPRQDVLCFLLNGVETRADLQALAKKFPLRAEAWQELLDAPKPVSFNVLLTVGRIREPSTITIVNAFANAFFSMFGTNEAPDSSPSP